MIVLAAALLALAAPPQPAYVNHCGLERLSACRNTNELVVRPEFQKAMREFAGGARSSFIAPGSRGPLAGELMEAIHGAPQPPVRLRDGSYFFQACVPHYCLDTGAVIVSPKGKILAAAMFTGNPTSDAHGAPYRLSLDVFVRDPKLDQPWRSAIAQFGRERAEAWRRDAKEEGRSVVSESTTFWRITPRGRLYRVQSR